MTERNLRTPEQTQGKCRVSTVFMDPFDLDREEDELGQDDESRVDAGRTGEVVGYNSTSEICLRGMSQGLTRLKRVGSWVVERREPRTGLSPFYPCTYRVGRRE